MSHAFRGLMLLLIAAGGMGGAHAACVEIAPGDIPGFETGATGLRIGSGRASRDIAGARLEAGVWKVTAADVDSIRSFAATLTDPAAPIGVFQMQGERAMVVQAIPVTRDAGKLSLCRVDSA